MLVASTTLKLVLLLATALRLRLVAGGCNLNRNISDLISKSGFEIKKLETEFARKTPKIAGYIYFGEAVIAQA